MIFNIAKKIKVYLLYGVAFSFVVTISSYIGDLLSSKNLPAVSKKIQLPPIIPTTSADDGGGGGAGTDGTDGSGDSCDTG